MIRKSALLILVSLLVFLTACDAPDKSQQVISSQQSTENIQNVAWMREKLPANTLAYVRIPTLWEMLFEAKGDALHQLQKLDTHKSLIEQIKGGILDTYSGLLPDEAHLPFKSLVKSMTTPLEMAVLNADDGSMIPNMLFATTLKDTSIEELNSLVNTLIELLGPQMKIISPFNAQGQAQLLAAMIPIFASFDDKTGQLILLSGLSANETDLQKILTQTQHAPELDEIFAYENSVDQAGKNLEFWLNVKAIYQQNKGFIPADIKPMLMQMGLDQIEYLWAGTASANGKSEMIFRLSMPEVGFRQFMPRVDSQLNVLTAGSPRSVWQLAIPSVKQMKQGFDLILGIDPDTETTRKEITVAIDKVNKFLGVSLTEIFNVYGQKILIITDESGTWFASKIKDKAAYTDVSKKLAQAFKVKTSSRKLAGVEIQQTVFSTKEFEQQAFAANADPNILEKLLDVKQYYYYQIEGDYILYAFTPQVLADRANNQNKMELQDWLYKQQAQNWDHAIIAYGKEVLDAPRDIYYFYLNVLAFLGNLTNVEVDLFSFPTAQQLNLPQKGRYGFTLDSSNDALTIKLSYEYSFLENMSIFDSYLSIAYVGIMMAYAVPAYRDYTARVKVNEKIYSVSEEKILIAEYYAEHGSFPNTEFLSTKFDESDELLYNPKNGQISIYFTGNITSELKGQNIILTPTADDSGYISWQCSGTVDIKRYKYACY
ncbi:MAG: pilin [Alcanivoracaceae bacterium]|nr:pilin [Alcanivoracaceae bacterium]